MKKFDLIAIGTGSGASGPAYRCRTAGWEVAVVDSRPFGGTCALRGCDPKKVLVGAAELMDWNRRMQGRGISAQSANIDWRDLMRFKRSFTDPVPQRREESFSKAGIATFHGRARFVSPRSIRVGEDVLEARYFLVATGQKPATLGIPGEEHLTRSDQFLELDELPPRIVFIGGGYISFEFAHVAARAGKQATILHRSARPLPRFDPDLADQLVERTREIGIRVELEAQAGAIGKGAGGFSVHASLEGKQTVFEADMVVHGAGRVAEIEDLGLDVAGVKWNKRGVAVNEHLQSISNPSVYAAGDAAASGGPPLTPIAGYEGRIVASNLLKGNHLKPDYRGVPSVVFTTPPLASVGLHERTAREQGLRFRVKHEKTSGWYSSRRVAETCSGFKVLIEEGSDRILGAHLLGPDAGETINLFAFAIRSGLRAQELKEMIFAYPTHASDVGYMV